MGVWGHSPQKNVVQLAFSYCNERLRFGGGVRSLLCRPQWNRSITIVRSRASSGRRAPESPRRGSRDPNRYRHAQHHTQLRRDDSTQLPAKLPIWEQVLPDSDVLATRLMAPRTQLGAKICVSIQQIASGLTPDRLSGLKVRIFRIFSYFRSHIICLGANR